MTPSYHNILKVYGKISEIRKFDKIFSGKHIEYKGYTMPYNKNISIDNLISKTLPDNKITVLKSEKEVEGYSFSNFIQKTKEDFLNNWFKWNIFNWGCSSDVKNIRPLVYTLYKEENDPNKKKIVEYSFNTNNGTCIPIIKKMSELFKSLQFEILYHCEDIYASGRYTFKNGERIEVIVNNSTCVDYRIFLESIYSFKYTHRCTICNCLIDEYDYSDEKHLLQCPSCLTMDKNAIIER